MKCYYCQSELVEDLFGNLCPNEECESIDGNIRIEIWNNGTKCWNKNGKRHRDNGPAVKCYNGTNEWYQDGLLHRLDGPAIEVFDGSKHWYLNGKRHRENGPAIECPDGTKEYWINGKRIK